MQVHEEGPDVDGSFGSAVQAVRTQRGLSQRAFAEALGGHGLSVDASAISRIENGTRAVRLSEAVAIAKVLEVQLDFLLSGAATERAFDAAGRQYLHAERDLTRSAWLYTDAQLRLAAAGDLEALGQQPLWEPETPHSRVRDLEYHETLERMQTSPVRVVRSVLEAALPSVLAGRGMLLTQALAEDWQRDAYYTAADESG
ncbi:helix-turn-helix domain-containing protein [Amnibacterium kyonggiense]|uniref:Transcriptional regulator with XRE-family HTH domain n=1 Tax=Amnibacterium kyonggiense TaxID=595671 RepID=A0A4R7FF04_9MICO|nr:helix-turn-helix transcriptional regulator [Amnibacterium kyonggiense]TDS75929.1 transcriptional regulator with XRE-family HTH domain [Amnibacterium kyonggiense]